jgi:hypothetical protein
MPPAGYGGLGGYSVLPFHSVAVTSTGDIVLPKTVPSFMEIATERRSIAVRVVPIRPVL